MKSLPIGIFDSGVGGLTVLKEIHELLPYEDLIYLGDTARVPWGNRGNQVILDFSSQLARYLISRPVKYLVIACHTASAISVDYLTHELKIPLTGVIKPSLSSIMRATSNLQVGIIGTQATINSDYWQNQLKNMNSQLKITALACPLLVPLIEEGYFDHQATRLIVEEYFKPFKLAQIDTLVLACTHYPLITSLISQVIGPQVRLINPGHTTAVFLKQDLISRRLQNTSGGHLEVLFTDPEYRASKAILEKLVEFSPHATIKAVSLTT